MSARTLGAMMMMKSRATAIQPLASNGGVRLMSMRPAAARPSGCRWGMEVVATERGEADIVGAPESLQSRLPGIFPATPREAPKHPPHRVQQEATSPTL